MTDKTKASHTPGPWEQGWYKSNPTVFDSRGNGTIPIATCHDITTSSAEANAKLIAAAPDMLQALYTVRAYLCRVHSAHVVEEEFPFLTEVIKKATCKVET